MTYPPMTRFAGAIFSEQSAIKQLREGMPSCGMDNAYVLRLACALDIPLTGYSLQPLPSEQQLLVNCHCEAGRDFSRISINCAISIAAPAN
jgi:hypothetical protein